MKTGARKDAIEKFRAELIKTVADQIVDVGYHDDVSTRFRDLHAIFHRHRDMEDVFERSAINHEVETFVQIRRHGEIQIVNDICAFVT